MDTYLAGALIDQRVPSDGGTLTWAHVSRTGSGELTLTTNTTGAAPRFNLATGEHGPTEVQGDSELISTFSIHEAMSLAKLLEVDSDGELIMLLRAAAAQAIELGD